MPDHKPWPVPAVAHFDGPPDAPVLVLGNSLGTSIAVWNRQVSSLEQSYRLLRFELPGHGGTVSWPGPYTIDDLGSGVLALLDSLGIERAAYCGISLGGMIGMWLAARAAERITTLGLVCTSACLPPASAWHDRAGQVRTAGLGSISAQVVSRWFTDAYAAAAPSVVGSFRAMLEQTDPEGYAGCCEAIAGMDLLDALPAITAPTLVIAAADDPATPPEHGAAIAERVGRSRLVVIPGAAHLAAVSAPEAVGQALLDHLDVTTGANLHGRDVH